MATVGTKVDVTLKLAQLQNLCKRDPPAYLEDYQAQVRRLQSEIQISSKPETLVELIQFAAAVSSSSYKGEESDKISTLLKELLVKDVHKDVRRACVSALILMRNKGAIEPLDILELFFQTMCTADKSLREQLFKHLVNDVRNVNKKKRDEKLNRSIQTFLHKILNNESTSELACKRAIDMVCDLYRRKVWVDDRVIAIAATAVESKHVNVSNRAMRFFLNIEEIQDKDEKTQGMNEWNRSNDIDYHLYSKKTKSRKRQTQRALKNRKKAQQKKEDDEYDIDMNLETSRKLFPVIEMLRDPQGLAEKVFRRLKSSNDKYETKLLRINFVTRLTGNHELLILPLYSYLQKYMNSHQRNVTNVLAYTVQACHKLVPPDEILGIIQTISHQFITERCSEEEMAVGINAVRAICSRVPAVLNLDYMKDLVGDLANFSKHRDRSVRMAGASFVNHVRAVHPGLLQQKFRGMQGSALYKNKTKPLEYGQGSAASGVEGADLLVAYEAKKAAAKSQGDDLEEDTGSDNYSEEDSDAEAPQLVKLNETDISKMSLEERDKLKQDVSKTRVFSSSEFRKMRKLVEREERAKRDPREAARRKRAEAKGGDYDELSDSDSSDDEIHIAGRVNPEHIMALASKRRISKEERLQKIMQGRTVFESKKREGGSTNVEKQRKKNFLMSKFSKDARQKGRGKGALQQKRNHKSIKGGHESRKRRRKV